MSKLINKNLNSFNDTENDVITNELREYWDLYSKFTKQIIIIEPHPTFYKTPATSMLKLLREGQNIKDYYVTENDWDKEVNPGWWRIQASIDQCEICSTVSIKKHFCHEDKRCDIYDRETKFLFYCDLGHFSPLGTSKIMNNVVNKISKKLIY